MLDLVTLARKRFDYVVVDGPPVLGIADALLIADVVDATLLVGAEGMSRRHALLAALGRLAQVQARLVGVVVNRHGTSQRTYYYERYYAYGYRKGLRAS